MEHSPWYASIAGGSVQTHLVATRSGNVAHNSGFGDNESGQDSGDCWFGGISRRSAEDRLPPSYKIPLGTNGETPRVSTTKVHSIASREEELQVHGHSDSDNINVTSFLVRNTSVVVLWRRVCNTSGVASAHVGDTKNVAENLEEDGMSVDSGTTRVQLSRWLHKEDSMSTR